MKNTKKVLALLLSAIMILGLTPAYAASPVHITVTAANPSAEFEGWGTSLCWWAETIGAETEAERREFTKLLFDEDEGLGLNIVRYNVGGGDNPEHKHFREGGNVPVWKDKDGAFNPDADPTQLAVLQDAVYFGADTVELFSNSPPYYLTESGCSGGGKDPNKNNIEPRNFAAFAEYLAEVTDYIHNSMGIKVNTVEPMNEPCTNFWGYEGWQEGCHIDAEDHSALILALRKALDNKGLNSVSVAASDENSFGTMLHNLDVYSADALAVLPQINAHSYNGNGSRAALRKKADELGKKLYMSEFDGDGSVSPVLSGNMGPALWFSKRLTDDMAIMRPNAWILWQAAPASPGPAEDRGYWNICQYDINSDKADLFKKYYAYAHYTKFIRPGDRIIETNSSAALAVRNYETGKTVVVLTNADGRSRDYEIDLSPLEGVGTLSSVYVTDKTANLEKRSIGAMANKVFKVSLPEYSIATVVIENASPVKVGEASLTLDAQAESCFPGNNLKFTANAGAQYTAVGGNISADGSFTAGNEGMAVVTAALPGTDISASKRVEIIQNGDAVRLINAGSGLALQQNFHDDGLAQENDNDSAFQYWEIQRIGDIASFRNLRTGLLLSDDGGTEWKIELHDGGWALINTKTNKALDVYGHAVHEGAMVGTYEFGGGENQLWNFSRGNRVMVVDELMDRHSNETLLKPVSIEGTDPYGGNQDVSFEKAFDGSLQTHHDAWDGDNSFISAAMPCGKAVNLIRFCPREGFAFRMYGGTFYGVKDGTETLLYTVPETIQNGWNEAYIDNSTVYDKIIYRTPKGGLCNVAEIEYYSCPFEVKQSCENEVLLIKVKNHDAAAKLSALLMYHNGGSESGGELAGVDLQLLSLNEFGESEITIPLNKNYESVNVYVMNKMEIISSGYIFIERK